MIDEVKVTGPDEVTILYQDGSQVKMAGHVWNMRLTTIKCGLEWEMRTGGKLTAKAPSCFTIIREDFGIKCRDKSLAYQKFCQMFEFEPKVNK